MFFFVVKLQLFIAGHSGTMFAKAAIALAAVVLTSSRPSDALAIPVTQLPQWYSSALGSRPVS